MNKNEMQQRIADAMSSSAVAAPVNVFERTPKIKAPPRKPPVVVRHKGTIQGDVLYLERGAWIRALAADGSQISDLYDARFICRLEIGDGAVITQQNGDGLCTVLVTAVLADWGRKFQIANAAFTGAVFVLPANGLRQ